MTDLLHLHSPPRASWCIRHAVVSWADGGARLALSPYTATDSDLDVHFEGQTAPRFRTHHDLVAVWDPSGRIVVADLSNNFTHANMRTSL